MLTRLALQNFKVWEKCSLELGRVTVLIGPNGSGKSSLLQALALLKQSRSQLVMVWDGPYVSLRWFDEVVSSESDRSSIQLQLSFNTDAPQNLPGISGRLECDYSLKLDDYGPVDHKTEYRIAKSGFMATSYDFRSKNGTLDIQPSSLLNPVQINPAGLIAVPLYIHTLPGDGKLYKAARGLGDVVLAHLGNTYIVNPQRAVDAASYPGKPGGADFTEAGDVANFAVYNDDARRLVSDWISRIFDEDIRLSTKFLPNYQATLQLIRGQESTYVAHEGAGIQNLIWPLAQIAAAPAGSLIALEEPEVHLHPKAQARVGQALTDIARTEDKHILVTTQSEHILMSFLTEAVKSSASPDDFRVYYCSSRHRAAEIEELRLDSNGGLDGGLKGFFEAGFDETQRYLEALTARNSG